MHKGKEGILNTYFIIYEYLFSKTAYWLINCHDAFVHVTEGYKFISLSFSFDHSVSESYHKNMYIVFHLFVMSL